MKKAIKTLLLFVTAIVMSAAVGILITSPTRVVSDNDFGEKNASVYFNQSMNDLIYSVTGSYGKYALPYDISPAPKASDANFSTVTEDGVKKYLYEDETINVVCWKEKITTNVNGRNYTSEFTFADVQISDPSQFRRGWAGTNPKSPITIPPTNIFNNYNGIVGMSSDYYSFRNYGIIYQYGEEIINRKSVKDSSNDVLVVDYNGDFQIYDSVDMNKKIKAEGSSFTDNIMFSFTFGPALVVNGENTHSSKFTTQKLGELYDIKTKKPNCQARACIGQLGTLHYLLCTVGEPGTDMEGLADVMAEKGCITAYNLDGGQSGTLLYKDGHINNIAYNSGSTEKYGERQQDNIIYFGTAKR